MIESAPDNRNFQVAQSLSKLSAAAVFLTGLAVLAGWAFDVPALKSIDPAMVTMKANTALCFALIGASLWLRQAGPSGSPGIRVGWACGALVALIGLLTLAEYLSGYDMRIDQLLFKEDAGAVATFHPGRMAPNTALCFLAIGAALLLLDVKAGGLWLSEPMIQVAGLIGTTSLVGYIYGVTEFTGLASYTKMAVHTAVAFVVTYIGLIAARRDRGLARMFAYDSPGGMLMRWLLPAVVVFLVFVGWLRLAGERLGLYSTAFGTALFTVVRVVVIGAIVTVIAQALHELDSKRRQAAQAIERLNEELKRRSVELEAANKELEAFSYSVSHDLRAPLRHIDGFSKLLLEEHGPELSDQAQHYLTRVRDGARRMGQLVDDLLSLSRVGRQQLRWQIVGLNSLVEEVRRDLKPEMEGRQIDWKVGELPFVECDPALIKQVFANLLSNALKFSRPRERAVMEVGTMTRDGQTVVFVRDNGVGFSMKYADKLFGIFQRLHRQEDFEGTGVGLATVQRVLHKHGGRVWAEGELDKGATFYFALGGPEGRRTGEAARAGEAI